MEDKIRNFEKWYEDQPKFKQFLALTGIIGLGLVALIGVITVLAAIVIWTIQLAIFVNPWFFLLAAAEAALVLGGLFAFVIVND